MINDQQVKKLRSRRTFGDSHKVKLGRNDRKQMLDWAMASGLWVSPSSSLRIIFLADDIQCRCDFKSNYAIVPVVPNCFSQLFLQVRLKMKLSVSIYAMIAGLLLGCIAQQSSQGQTPQESAVAQTLDVSFIPSDFCAAVVVHPARIAKSGVADQLPIDDLAQKFVGLAGFDLRDCLLYTSDAADE